MTEEELEQIQRRRQAVRFAEWRAEQIGSGYAVQQATHGEWLDESDWVSLGRCDPVNKVPVFGRDAAEFIAHAPADVAALVDEVRRLRALLGEARPLVRPEGTGSSRYQERVDLVERIQSALD